MRGCDPDVRETWTSTEGNATRPSHFVCPKEEADLLDRLVAISGMTKQDYIISKLSDTEVKVVPSSRMQKGMEEAMLLIYRELLRITDAKTTSSRTCQLTEKVGSIFAGLEE